MIHLLQKPLLGVPVNWSHPLARGLVGCYLMNEGGGDKIYDLSGNQNTGIFGVGTAAPTWTAGKFGSALLYDGIDSVINCGIFKDNALAENGRVTFSIWINPNTVGGGSAGRIFARGSVLLYHSTTALRFQVTGSTNLVRLLATNSIIFGVWQHILLTWDGSVTAANVHIYVNSKECSYTQTTNGVDPVDNSTAPIYLGNSSAGTRSVDGIIDNVQIWNRVLSAAEIARLYREPFAMFDRPSIGLLYVPPAGGQTILDYERSHRGAARGVLVGVP
jgi:hypothetical protein